MEATTYLWMGLIWEKAEEIIRLVSFDDVFLQLNETNLARVSRDGDDLTRKLGVV